MGSIIPTAEEDESLDPITIHTGNEAKERIYKGYETGED
jgi:hypothetical protein